MSKSKPGGSARGRAAKRDKPIHVNGIYALYARPGTNHTVIYYDEAAKRERSFSAGTRNDSEAVKFLDDFVQRKRGACDRCPECNQLIITGTRTVADCIDTYLKGKIAAKKQRDRESITARLNHVVRYMAHIYNGRDTIVRDVDEDWIKGFRDWLKAEGFRCGKDGQIRKEYAASTIEMSVVQLASALVYCKERSPQNKLFEPVALKPLSKGPKQRADVKTIAAMFDYCLNPAGASVKIRAQRRQQRLNLLTYLRVSVVTMARPEAVTAIDCSSDAGQWLPELGMLALCPEGDEQTKKFRPTVPIVEAARWIFDEATGKLFTGDPTQSTWKNMAKALNLPGQGKGGAGSKLIRRSMARLAKTPLKEHRAQLAGMMGHHKATTTGVYTMDDEPEPEFFTEVSAFVTRIVDEIEALCPGAYYRNHTATEEKIVSIAA